MPASERELAVAVYHRSTVEGKLNVLYVTGSDCPKDEKDMRDAFNSGADLEVVRHLVGFSELAEKKQNVFDALVVNKLLITDQIVNEPQKLDVLVTAAFKVLKLGGVFVIREDLSSFNVQKISQLTNYFDVYRVNEDGKNIGFDFYAMNQVKAAIFAQQNFLDVYWVFTKKAFPGQYEENLVTFRDFLDKTQYTDNGITAYEWIFGDNFISPGGAPENLKFLKRFKNLKTGQTMLDIGVGIGGGARQAAHEFGLHVVGCDLSANMLSHAFERNQRDKDCRVSYSITDILVYDYPEGTFDYVYSRDCIHHIEDVDKLFEQIYKCLKPGGEVVISAYARGLNEYQPKFAEYVKNRHYHMKTLDEYRQLCEKVGFVDVKTENITARFGEILDEEREKVEKDKEDFIKKFDQSTYDRIVDGWKDKVQYIADDNHNWVVFQAVKPLH
ncbi:hypothetical protein QR680_004706 [Steinernema hermaphroditum]|uniref:phosphoethanolamine N-methyltransferase n=1 Tax=Steinernema hermaphroditum TaxID=289476 RepID=A0AA39LU48_9BILA|nr:hypothetical protein QR680_004706 [Steinernema hermaphroditum]